MAHTAKVQPDASPPPVYTEQPAAPSAQAAVFHPQPGYPAQPEMPGYPQKEGYPAQQPAYPGPHPFAAQPGYPPQAVQHIQQTSTVLMQQPTTQAFVIQTPPRPSSWLGLSIFTFLCCGWLFGLIAIMFSCMVDSAYNRGDYEEARRNSNIAKWLNIVAILSGVGITIYVIVHFTVLVHRVVTVAN